MKSDSSKISNDKDQNDLSSPLRIEEAIRYLHRLADLNKSPRIGNVEMSFFLNQLVKALHPYSKLPAKDVASYLAKGPLLSKRKRAPKKQKVELPPNLTSLTEDRIDAVLKNSDYTKAQLIELGFHRFGIPRSKLLRLCKEEVVEGVQAALNHERTLGVISQEARRSGEERSS